MWLNDEVPTDITLRLGGGEAHLNIGTLSLRSVEIEMGAGEMELDLRGMPKHSYNVRVRGGAGEATVRLPHNVGIYAQAEGALGDIKAQLDSFNPRLAPPVNVVVRDRGELDLTKTEVEHVGLRTPFGF